MKTVKRRDFERQFSKYMDECVIIVGRHGEQIGVWKPITKEEQEDQRIGDLLSKARKENMDDLVAGVMNKDGITSENNDAHVEGVKRSMENEEVEPILFDDVKTVLNEESQKCLNSITEMCTRCKKQQTELWIVYGGPMGENHMCKQCIEDNIDPKQLQSYLKTVEKVEIGEIDFVPGCTGPHVNIGRMNEATKTSTSTFKPMPKPVKKKKKKS